MVIIIVPSSNTFEAASLKRTMWSLFRPESLVAGLRAAGKGFFFKGKLQGDGLQLGGVLVVRPPDRVTLHYASRFAVVEVDSPFYALPTAGMAAVWVARTPDDFVFDVKAHALMTGHATDVRRLPTVLRAALPADVAMTRFNPSSFMICSQT